MTTTKHTPGPWTFYERDGMSAAWAKKAVAEGADVDCTGPTEPGWYIVNDDGDCIGPIEPHPRMAYRLGNINLHYGPEMKRDDLERLKKDIEAVSAAIAKAEGN